MTNSQVEPDMGTHPGVRYCTRCAARLARDNRERRCAACQSGERDALLRPPVLSLDFWQTDRMRDALNGWHMGHVLLAYRTHPYHGRTLSQEQVAGWLRLTQAQLSRIEKGCAPQDLAKLMRWAHTLGIPGDLLWFKLPSQRTAQPPSDVPRPQAAASMATVEASTVGTMTELERRAFLAKGLAVVSLPALGLDDLQHIAAALEDARRYLDHDVVRYFQEQITACADSDGAAGPKESLPAVLGVVAAVERTAQQVRHGVRRDLLRVGARAAEFAGWLYRDIGVPEMADYWRDRAVEWAQEAGDTAMQGYVLLKKSQAAWDGRDALRMLALAQAVQDGPWRLPPKVRAEAAQQEARGHAMLGEDMGTVERKLDEARQLLDQEDATDSGLGAHYGRVLLAMQTAMCYAEAGQPLRSADIYQRQLSARAFSHRDYGYFLSLMGSTLATAGEPDEAARVGTEALAVACGTHSVRTMQELRRLTDRLEPWAQRSSVRQLREALST